eukprot:723088-Prorocentrum_minimum.AAC.2
MRPRARAASHGAASCGAASRGASPRGTGRTGMGILPMGRQPLGVYRVICRHLAKVTISLGYTVAICAKIATVPIRVSSTSSIRCVRASTMY